MLALSHSASLSPLNPYIIGEIATFVLQLHLIDAETEAQRDEMICEGREHSSKAWYGYVCLESSRLLFSQESSRLLFFQPPYLAPVSSMIALPMDLELRGFDYWSLKSKTACIHLLLYSFQCSYLYLLILFEPHASPMGHAVLWGSALLLLT